MFDPVGPGTPAWNQFEKALAAWTKVKDGQHYQNRDKNYKAWANHRYYMKQCLKRAGLLESEIQIWLATLKAECKGRVMDEFGEYR